MGLAPGSLDRPQRFIEPLPVVLIVSGINIEILHDEDADRLRMKLGDLGNDSVDHRFVGKSPLAQCVASEVDASLGLRRVNR